MPAAARGKREAVYSALCVRAPANAYFCLVSSCTSFGPPGDPDQVNESSIGKNIGG